MKTKMRSEAWLAIGLFALAGLAALLVTLFGSRATAPYSIHNSGPNGLSIYAQWLSDQGYHVQTAEGGTSFRFPASSDVLFIVDPDAHQVFTNSAAEALRRWVDQGHTLLLALDSQSGDNLPLLSSLFGASPAGTIPGATHVVDQPLGPASVRAIRSSGGVAFRLTSNRYVNYIAVGDNSTFAALGSGDGVVLLLGTPDILTNQQLGEADNARLALDLAARAPAGGHITFDEFHHGFLTAAPSNGATPDLTALLFTTPAGWAVLYLAALVLLALALNGQRLGPAIAARAESGRASVEYIVAMAGLLRLADSSAATLAHYQRQCQRALARRYGVDVDLPLATFIQALEAAGAPDTARIATLLHPPGSRLHPRELLAQVNEIEALRRAVEHPLASAVQAMP